MVKRVGIEALLIVALLAVAPSLGGRTVLPTVRAQERDERGARLARHMARAADRLDRTPTAHRSRLSAGAKNFFHAAQQWSRVEPKVRAFEASGATTGPSERRGQQPRSPRVLTDDRVSDPLADAAAGAIGAGFTQSETSTAWCGSNVVVGFNDSGGLAAGILAGGGPSFGGYALSTDGGATFTDRGFLPVAKPDRDLLGDPTAACTDPGTFYYASLLIDFGPFTTGASVSKSSDGGLTFGDPVKVVEKDLETHFIDKEWIAADPTNPNRLYVSYGDFDGSGSICGADPDGFPIFREGIELVRSDDGGVTWSAPSVIASTCGDDGVFGSQVVVDDHGRVSVAWTFRSELAPNDEIRLRKSTDGGTSFGPPVRVASAVPVGGEQGLIRAPLLSALAVDRSSGPNKGNIYLSWHDGRYAAVPDGLAFDGVYAFSNIVFVRSTDGGQTFDPSPTRVSQDASPAFTDHFMPALGVDTDGTIGICYYDRSRDPSNFFIDRRCARSRDGGRHWTARRINRDPSLPATGQDSLVARTYQGDYDTLTGDFLLRTPGLLGAYTDTALGNQDVKANRVGLDPDEAGGSEDLEAAPHQWAPTAPSRLAAAPNDPATVDKIALYNQYYARLRDVLGGLPSAARERLSGASGRLVARVLGPDTGAEPDAIGSERDDDDLGQGPLRIDPSFSLDTSPRAGGAASSAGRISDPTTDLAFSRLSGFTQNTAATAWCGDVVVVAFDDTGSFGETLVSPLTGVSFLGFARSTNAGRSFTDLGFLGTGGNFALELEGEPIVACTDPTTFHYSSLATDFDRLTGAVTVAASTDGGLTFGGPIKAVEKSLFTHILTRQWLAVDPTDPGNLYVAYADIDFSGSICPFHSAIELVRSSDGGRTWGAPVEVTSYAESCEGEAEGSRVEVDARGTVHVAWEQFNGSSQTFEIRIARSPDRGASFNASVKVADVNVVGDFHRLQGGVLADEFPALAVDRSSGPSRGTLHIAWNDGALQVPHPRLTFGGVETVSYGFADVLATRSTDGGATWTQPVRVNDDREPLTTPAEVAGQGTDQFDPAIAVDRDGVVGVCFYDRRRDPLNFLIDRRCARSTDDGRHWENSEALNEVPFQSVMGEDLLFFGVGDYDTLASDFLQRRGGFVGGYGDNSRGNPDVKVNAFR